MANRQLSKAEQMIVEMSGDKVVWDCHDHGLYVWSARSGIKDCPRCGEQGDYFKVEQEVTSGICGIHKQFKTGCHMCEVAMGGDA